MSRLESLPDEVMLTIVEFTNSEDHLSLMLTCKKIHQFLPGSLQEVLEHKFGSAVDRRIRAPKGWGAVYQTGLVVTSSIPHALTALVQCHMHVEEHYNTKNHKGNKTALLACTQCGKLKPVDDYVDGQRQTPHMDARSKPEIVMRSYVRICNPCAVNSPIYFYSSRRNLSYGGNKCFVCRYCAKALPPDAEYEGKKNKSMLKRILNALAGSSWCKTCAKKINKKYPGCFKGVEQDQAKTKPVPEG